jgi:hypothetical protein
MRTERDARAPRIPECVIGEEVFFSIPAQIAGTSNAMKEGQIDDVVVNVDIAAGRIQIIFCADADSRIGVSKNVPGDLDIANRRRKSNGIISYPLRVY